MTTILYEVSDQRRVTVCIHCRGPLVLVLMHARGAYGADGKPRVRGTFWKLEHHSCEPVVAELQPDVGSPAGEQA